MYASSCLFIANLANQCHSIIVKCSFYVFSILVLLSKTVTQRQGLEPVYSFSWLEEENQAVPLQQRGQFSWLKLSNQQHLYCADIGQLRIYKARQCEDDNTSSDWHHRKSFSDALINNEPVHTTHFNT